MTSPGHCLRFQSLSAQVGSSQASPSASASASSSRSRVSTGASASASASGSTFASISGHFLINGRSWIASCSDCGSGPACYTNLVALRKNRRAVHSSKRFDVKVSAGDICACWHLLSADGGSTNWLRHGVNLPWRNDSAPSDELRRSRWKSEPRIRGLRGFGDVAAVDSDINSEDTQRVEKGEAQFDGVRTRRDVLVECTSALGLAVSNLWKTDAAKASVSQQVRLEDVEDQKLQEALKAAVSGELENAEDLFTELIRMDPESASGWSNRGSVRVSLGKYKEASDDFTKAIELAPNAPVPYLNRAISYEAQGFYDEAIGDCKSAIQNDPEEPAAWFNLGNVEARVKDFDSSLLAYKRASDLAPGIAGYRLKQALVLFQVGRMEEAKKLIQGLVRKYPTYTEAHAALAAILWNEGQRSKAEEQFTTATSQEPLYNKLSWVEAELQWPPGVVTAFSKFLAIDYSNS